MAERVKLVMGSVQIMDASGEFGEPYDEAVIHLEGDEDSEITIRCPGALQIAPEIVKAVNNHDALSAFFKWAIQEGPFDGCDLDGASIQDKAEELGLIIKTTYDPKRHGENACATPGCEWFEIAPSLTSVGEPR